MTELVVRKIEDAHGVILPENIIGRLNLEEGSRLYLTEAPDGGYRITPFDPEFEQQMTLAEGIMNRYPNTLKELAK